MDAQRSAAWFADRKGMITGSIAGACLGLSEFRTQEQVMRQMVRDFHGEPSEFVENPATLYGKTLEQTALECYQLSHDKTVWECGFIRHNDWLGASPDGLIYDGSTLGVLEIKCPFGLREGGEFKEIKYEYYAQVQIEMLCAGAEFCHFYQWGAQGDDLQVIQKDQKWLDLNIPLLQELHKKFQRECRNLAHLEPLPKKVRKNVKKNPGAD